MTVTFLGTGTSSGVPMLGCSCAVCRSEDPRDKRLRCAVLIEVNGLTIAIDSGPDFRQQLLRENTQALDAIILTHEHYDHIAGLDEIRPFNYFSKKAMPIYATEAVEMALRKTFHYIFGEKNYPGIPELKITRIQNFPFYIEDIEITPIQVYHYNLPVFGYRIENFSYITDSNRIPETEMEKLYGSKVLVINALRKEKHISHFNLDEAIKLIEQLKPETAYLTHISHQLGKHSDVETQLPKNVLLGYDGLKLYF